MSEKNEHWDEIVDLIKVNQRQQYSNVEALDSKRSVELQNHVYSHIDTQFPPGFTESRTAQQTSADQVKNSRRTDTHGALLNWLRDRLMVPPLAVGMAAMAVVAVISISLFNNSNDFADPYFEVAQVTADANLGSQIQPVGSGSRAFVATDSAQTSAFFTGVLQADLDLAGISNEIVSANIVTSYPELFKDTVNPPAKTILERFQSQVVTANSGKDNAQWFKEGYRVEVAYLAAESALETFKTDALQEALAYFQQQADFNQAAGANVNSNYLAKRKLLSELAGQVKGQAAGQAAGKAEALASPENLQQVVELTKALKVLVR